MILLRGIIPRSSPPSLPPRVCTRQQCHLRTTKSWLPLHGLTNHARLLTTRTTHPRHTIPLLSSRLCRACITPLPCSHGQIPPVHTTPHPPLFRTFMQTLHLQVMVYLLTIAAIRLSMVRRGHRLRVHHPHRHGPHPRLRPRNTRPRRSTIHSNSHSKAVRRVGARLWGMGHLLLRRGRCRWLLLE